MYLTRIKDNFDLDTRTLVIDSLVLSIVNYCSNVWGCCNKTQLQRVQKLQNFAAKVAVGGLSKFDHATPAINRLNWLKIENKSFYDLCLFIFKILNDKVPNWLYTNITNTGMERERETRQSKDLIVGRAKTILGSRRVPVRGPTTWNKLPPAIRELKSIYVFKEKLKEYLIAEQSNVT